MNLTTQTHRNPAKGIILVKEPEVYKKNRLLESTMQFLVKNLLCEFNSKGYDGNRILRVAFEKVQSDPESDQKADVIEIWEDIELFIWNLTVCPKYWVVMFENQQFFSTANECVDMHVFTNKIYKYVLREAIKLTPYAQLLGEMVGSVLFMFLEEVSTQICDNYQQGREIIMAETRLVQEHIKNSKILNFYFIYKLLLEISKHCYSKIVEELSVTIFRNIQYSYCQSFADYILEKHEVLSLVFDHSSQTKNHEESLIDIIERIKSSNNLKWREAIRQDGEAAIIVEFENETEAAAPSENFMIKMDKKGRIKVLNCNVMRMKWMVTETAEKNYDIMNVVSDENKLGKRLRNSPTNLKDVTLTDQFSTMGGALGKCLANIKKYDSVGDFVFDFSKRSIINGTFNYIATNIPLIGILFATGGYTYTLYNIFSNKNVNKTKKFQKMGYLTFDIASTFGTGLIGAAVGQALIPMPVLGAFIGGFVGSFIGEIGGKALTNKIQSVRFKEIIQKLEATIQPAGYWEVNKQTLKILGLDRDHFYQTIPCQIEQRLGCDKIWFAMIGFTILSFNESKKRAQFMKEKMKIIEKEKEKEDFNLSFEKIKKELHFEPSMDLVCLMKYFENNNVDTITCFNELEEFVSDIFTLIQ